MKLFTAIFDDARLLRHFLRHYSRAGIGQFFIAVSPGFESAVETFKREYSITAVVGLDVADSFCGGTAAVTEMRRLYQASDEWVVIVDLDEFIEFPESIATILSDADREGTNVVRGIMHDRFSIDGRPVDFDEGSDLSQVYPVKSRFIRDVMKGRDHKNIIVKGKLRAVAAHHEFDGQMICSRIMEISHYKWNKRAVERVRNAYRMVLESGGDWADEYRRALDHFEKNGRFAWEEFGGQLTRGRV
jgi:hypothetical protein